MLALYVKKCFRFSDDDVDEMYREAPIKNGMFDYNEFTRLSTFNNKLNCQ